MIYLFELSKEHPTLPKAEILACLEAHRIKHRVLELNENVLLIKADSDEEKIKEISNRLSMTFYVDKLLFSAPTGDLDKIREEAVKNKISQNQGTIGVKHRNRSENVDSRPVKKILAEVYAKNRVVKLEKPDVEIRAFITDEKVYVGVKEAEINRKSFEKRKVQHRPFFSPVSLHPRLARTLVNLSKIKPHETLLDPFCGTGGFLIEAGLIGAETIGCDIKEEMIEGCRKTLDFYKIKKYKLFRCDIGETPRYVKKVDAVVTDLPYGKSTTTLGEELFSLYTRAFKTIAEVLKRNKRAVVGMSNADVLDLGANFFDLKEQFEYRVHRSLKRIFGVYEK